MGFVGGGNIGGTGGIGDLTDAAIEERHIANEAVKERHIADGAVSSTKLMDISVGTNKVINGAITEEKLSQEVRNKLNAAGNVENPTWQLLYSETMTEEVSAFKYTLDPGCKGVILRIKIPADASYTAGQCYMRSGTNSWIGSYYNNAFSTTTHDKEIRLVTKPENGYYYSYAMLRNGASAYAATRSEMTSTYFMVHRVDASDIASVEIQQKIPVGVTIEIWRLA